VHVQYLSRTGRVPSTTKPRPRSPIDEADEFLGSCRVVEHPDASDRTSSILRQLQPVAEILSANVVLPEPERVPETDNSQSGISLMRQTRLTDRAQRLGQRDNSARRRRKKPGCSKRQCLC